MGSISSADLSKMLTKALGKKGQPKLAEIYEILKKNTPVRSKYICSIFSTYETIATDDQTEGQLNFEGFLDTMNTIENRTGVYPMLLSNHEKSSVYLLPRQ